MNVNEAGRKGGSSKSKAKLAAALANARLGTLAQSSLTDAQVRQIRASDKPPEFWAKKLKVRVRVIKDMLSGRTYKNIK